MSGPETYELFAIRYGSVAGRLRRDNFIIAPDHPADPHDGPMPLDYFVWAIVNENRTIVVDTGFEYSEAEKRGRKITRLPRDGLEIIGINADTVEDVIITHLHYDHAGTLDDFPAARFHLQESEMNYATGKHMCHAPFGHAYAADHVCTMVRRVFDGRVVFHDGDREVAPGISVHWIGGHTAGVQCVRVLTKRGWVVLASDASHFYENMEGIAPFPIVYSAADMVQGYSKMRDLADSSKHIIPGHDPLVMQRYPVAQSGQQDVIRLDVAPKD
ncbi:MAG: N-acyl homoserine lactonase family protein [Rhodospirillaceae bacterium]|jgi:glyoxylase-like metal-dependent hydrolase (beta-lactamase superfamily II)|nr:N-acyl homoserine lactonase family protein [Rhodospirillaceae bacterium]MBT4691691.1 N-acyl homoserine lactonase family protein [Rhodospirillaceae bacterium]MBT5080988.1 N-acyl homoserine lactonase family protein [Rhodospirillaceae bacterium]MBT5527345.1 N-acyl homoserine lactonase family protein [Rhodospirillaceae bacterium]MBT5878353.1 N-acyl homoserine lactonase family protein [Rhodospirillaceae bacterium]